MMRRYLAAPITVPGRPGSAAWFRLARLALGLKQTDMARLLGYSGQPSVAMVEAGTRDASLTVTLLMTAYLDGYRPHDWPSVV